MPPPPLPPHPKTPLSTRFPFASILTQSPLVNEPLVVPKIVVLPLVEPTVGAAPAPPPMTGLLRVKAADDAHVDAELKYGMPPEVPATVRAKVPEVVMGEPATEIKPPVNVSPTLDTVPPVCQEAVVPFEVRTLPVVPIARFAAELAPLPSNKEPVAHPEGMAQVSVPEVVTGELVTVNPVGAAKPTEVTVPNVLQPALPLSIRFPLASHSAQSPLT